MCASDKCRTETTSYAEAVIAVIATIESAGAQTFPVKVMSPKSKKKSKILPGWMEMVKPQKETASFWHAVLVSTGSQKGNVLHSIMKSTKIAEVLQHMYFLHKLSVGRIETYQQKQDQRSK